MTSQHKTATWLALSTALISGFSIFLNKISVKVVSDPILFTTLKNAIVGLLLIGVLLAAYKWKEVRSLSRAQSLKLFAIGIIGGSVPFALFFTGLSMTSAINANLIHKTLFLWVLLLAIPFLRERLTPLQCFGVAAIFGANLLIGGFKGFEFNLGELMILGATILWAIENVIAKKALTDLSSLTVASARMVLGSLVLLGLVIWRGNFSMLYDLTTEQWLWTLIPSALLFGYVLTWYTALKYAPASFVATLLVPATLVTNALSAIFVTHAFSAKEFGAATLYIIGVVLMVVFARRSGRELARSKETSTITA